MNEKHRSRFRRIEASTSAVSEVVSLPFAVTSRIIKLFTSHVAITAFFVCALIGAIAVLILSCAPEHWPAVLWFTVGLFALAYLSPFVLLIPPLRQRLLGRGIFARSQEMPNDKSE